MLAVSQVHFAEIKATPNNIERMELLSIIELCGVILDIDLVRELGPVEAMRFVNFPCKRRQESVKRHREWQKLLDKDQFFSSL